MKIGITSLYYKSSNYGGNLQAYALCKWLEKKGHQAEQISFSLKLEPICSIFQKKTISENINNIVLSFKVHLYNMTFGFLKKQVKLKDVYSGIALRVNTVKKFNETQIPHSKRHYSQINIKKINNYYNCFITGSDIVWDPRRTSTILLLDFVPKWKPKFSYAASLPATSLSEIEKKKYEYFLKDYQGISVRESSTVELLSEISPVPPHCVVDPTLLLKKKDWDLLCSNKLINEEYLFCYFLGSNVESRKIASEYAKKRNLKIVTIPYLNRRYKECDKNFADEQLFDVSPSDFISLIKYADCVFTDSFHACVFSYIYDKNVFAFLRDENDNIGVRVKNFLELVNADSHYCDSNEKATLEYIENSIPAQSLYDSEKVGKLINSSVEYLNENLKKAEERIKNK